MTKIDTHLASLTDTITEQHDQLVTITKSTDSLYEYTHKNFRMLTEQLTRLQCKEHQEFEFLIRRGNMKARLYANFESALTVAFNGHPTPILLPPSAIRELMKITRICLTTRFIKPISISSTSTDTYTLCYQSATEKLDMFWDCRAY